MDESPSDKFKLDVGEILARHKFLILMLTDQCWNSPKLQYLVAQALRTKMNIISIHDTASIKRFPTSEQLPESIRSIMSYIAIKFIHQRASACWDKIIKRMKMKGAENIETDVFLSHKQSSGQGIALTLYEQLTSKYNLKPFLDVKAKFSLHDLKKIVTHTKLFVFILSEGIFDSYWCWQELQSAISSHKKIVFVCDSNYDPAPDYQRVAAKNIKWKRLLDFLEIPTHRENSAIMYDANYIGDCVRDIVKAMPDESTVHNTRLFDGAKLEHLIAPSLLALGGTKLNKVGKGNEEKSVEVFQTEWKNGLSMLTPRKLHKAVTFHESCVVVAGGWETKTAELFNETHWTPIASMNENRGSFGLVALGDKIYAMGGQDGKGETSLIEFYDPAINEWKKIRHTMLQQNFAFGYTSWNQTAVVGGGAGHNNRYSSIDQFDPREPKWNHLLDFPEPVSSLQMVAIQDDIYAIGGFNGKSSINTVRKFDIRTLKWMTDLPSMKKERRAHSAVVFQNKIVVLGGIDDSGECLDSAELYDPLVNEWTDLPAMKEKRSNFATAVL